MEETYQSLVNIVGADFVSRDPEERFIYSRDPGTMDPCEPDLVVMPDSTEEVRQIVLLANQKRIPIVPMGGGLVLSGITRPLKGGIVLDMKRMNRILEVNESGRSALVEAGASQGMLQAYLKKHHPGFKHSIPDAPPIGTIGIRFSFASKTICRTSSLESGITTMSGSEGSMVPGSRA